MNMRVTTRQLQASQGAECGVEAFASARVVSEHIDARLAAAPAPLRAPARREQRA